MLQIFLLYVFLTIESVIVKITNIAATMPLAFWRINKLSRSQWLGWTAMPVLDWRYQQVGLHELTRAMHKKPAETRKGVFEMVIPIFKRYVERKC